VHAEFLKQIMIDYELSFGTANAKLSDDISTFSLPSGYSCPGAKHCLAKADRETGKLTDGKDQQYRCFSAQQEVYLPTLRESRWENWDILLEHPTTHMMAVKLLASLPVDKTVSRIHVGGDYFSQAYFDAWLRVARLRPFILFYSYTKSVNFWVKRLNSIPKNFSIVASRGGKYDHLIDEYDLCSAKVVYHPDAAAALNLEIDHDDSHAMKADKDFALLIHGLQPKGSVMSEALKRMRKENIKFGYSSK
jgi:hypothetical protein